MDLRKVRIGVSGLTGEIYLYRHGKDKGLALDKRKAEPDVMVAFIEHMMHNAPKGSTRTVTVGTKQYVLQCKPGKIE